MRACRSLSQGGCVPASVLGTLQCRMRSVGRICPSWHDMRDLEIWVLYHANDPHGENSERDCESASGWLFLSLTVRMFFDSTTKCYLWHDEPILLEISVIIIDYRDVPETFDSYTTF